MSNERKVFEKLDGDEQEVFDQDRLFNPFHDTRVLYGDRDTEVKAVLAGIDMEVGSCCCWRTALGPGSYFSIWLLHTIPRVG